MNALWFCALWLKHMEEYEEELPTTESSIPTVHVSKVEKWLWRHPKLNILVCVLIGCAIGIIPELLGKILYYSACNWKR